jgi:hypothetical protein
MCGCLCVYMERLIVIRVIYSDSSLLARGTAFYKQNIKKVSVKLGSFVHPSPRNRIVHTSTGTRMASAWTPWSKSTLTSDLIIDNTGPW